MAVHKIRVLVVDDSILFRKVLLNSLEQDPYIEIAGYAVDSYDAFEKIESLRPDVITLDVEMPKMNGIEFLKKLMPVNPYPVVVVSSMPINALDALEAGAVDFVKKPVVKTPSDLQDFLRELISKIKIASIARIGNRREKSPLKSTVQDEDKSNAQSPSTKVAPEAKSAPKGPDTTADPKIDSISTTSQQRHERLVQQLRQVIDKTQKSIEKTRHTIENNDLQSQKHTDRPAEETSYSPPISSTYQKKSHLSLVAIGASTGGTEAVLQIIKDLPADFPCVLVVQHMPAGFTRMYAERLNRICKMSVKECEDGDRVKPGRIIVAAGEYHMWIEKDKRGYFVRSQRGEKVSGHCPSVDVLFDSVADVVGSSAVGVILTGMGSDGAKGLLKMRKEGCYTIGQDRDSCVVYGMPMVSFNIGAVVKQLPLDRIGSELVKFYETKPSD